MRVAVLWLGGVARETGGRTYFRNVLGPLARLPDIEVDVHLADGRFVVPEGCGIVRHRVPQHLGAPARIAGEALIARRLERAGYDVLLAPFNFLPPTWRGPSVVVQHNVLAGKGALAENGLLRAAYRRAAVAHSVARATRVIAVSEHLRGLLLEWYPAVDPARIHVVPLAPPLELLREAPARRPRPGAQLLVVAALWPHKQIDLAISALARLPERLRRDARLLVAGPGDPRALAEHAASVGFERVEFLGDVPPERLAGLYADSDALLFLSTKESFGLPVVEAMALGLPVVARRIPALVEIAGEAPLWVSQEATAEEVAARVEQLLEDRGLRERHAAAGRRAAARFSWEETARATAEILRAAARLAPPVPGARVLERAGAAG